MPDSGGDLHPYAFTVAVLDADEHPVADGIAAVYVLAGPDRRITVRFPDLYLDPLLHANEPDSFRLVRGAPVPEPDPQSVSDRYPVTVSYPEPASSHTITHDHRHRHFDAHGEPYRHAHAHTHPGGRYAGGRTPGSVKHAREPHDDHQHGGDLR